MEKRTPTKKAAKYDVLVPIGSQDIKLPDVPCFGKEYDNTDNLCAACSDNVLCASFMLRTTNVKKADEMKLSAYMDEEVWELVTADNVYKWILGQKSTTSQQLVDHILTEARSVDVATAILFVKRLKESHNITIKNKMVICQ